MSRHKIVSCPKCDQTFPANTEARIECPECGFSWNAETVSASETLVPSGTLVGRSQGPVLVLTTVSGRRQVHTLHQGQTVIGRGTDCDIVISDDLASREHAIVELTDGFCRLLDRSTNGTFIGKERMEEHLLVDGDRFCIGRLTFTYREVLDPSTPYGLAAEDVAPVSQRGLQGLFDRVRSDFRHGWRARRRMAALHATAEEAKDALARDEQEQERVQAELGREVFACGQEHRFPELADRWGELQTELGAIDERSTELGDCLQRGAEEIRSVEECHGPNVGQLEGRAQQLGEEVRQLETRVGRLEKAIKENERHRGQCERKVSAGGQGSVDSGELKGRLDQLADEARGLLAEREELGQQLAHAKHASEAASGDAQEARQARQAALDPLEASCAQLKREQDETQRQRSSLESQLTELQQQAGQAAANVSWDEPQLQDLVDQHTSLEERVAEGRTSAAENSRSCDLLRPRVRRMGKTAAMLSGTTAAAVTMGVLGFSVLAGMLDVGLFDSHRAQQNVGLVLAYGTYRLENGVLAEIPYGAGSSFAVSRDGYLLTNAHVTAALADVPSTDGTAVRVGPPQLVVCFGPNLEDHLPAKVIFESKDKQLDVAVLKVDRTFPNYYRLASSAELGTPVFACGFPGTTRTIIQSLVGDKVVEAARNKIRNGQSLTVRDSLAAADFVVSINDGRVAAFKQAAGVDWIEHTADIQKGNSGGPLLSLDSRIVGINTLGNPIMGANGQPGMVGNKLALEASQLKAVLDSYVRLQD